MTQAVKQVLDAFEGLSDAEKQQAAAEVLRRAMDLAPPQLPDEALVPFPVREFPGVSTDPASVER